MLFESFGAVSYSPSIVTIAVSVASKNGVTLKTGLGFLQGHWKRHNLIDPMQVPISIP